MSMIVPVHPRFWANHPQLLERWNRRHPNWQIGPNNPTPATGMEGLGQLDSTWLLAGAALLLFFTPWGKKLMKGFGGD